MICALYQRLQSITIGATTTVRGRVVTRWTADRWEVDTFGRERLTLAQAIARFS